MSTFANGQLVGIAPVTDNTGYVGKTGARFADGKFVSVGSADQTFKNGWKVVEAEDFGLEPGLVIVNKDGLAIWHISETEWKAVPGVKRIREAHVVN